MNLVDRLLDSSVYFSFDRSGYERHSKQFSNEILDGTGKVAIVTGANKGIGLAVTKLLCKSGVHVYMLCRSEERGKQGIKDILNNQPDAQLNLVTVDISEPKNIKRFIQSYASPSIDIVVNNAGGMPQSLMRNSDGDEMIWASHVLGHFVLTQELIEKDLLAKDARVITISSGGMYTQKLDLSDISFKQSTYNKYTAYANAKRAQVILNELWHQFHGDKVFFSCMHPGWAKTDGVRHSLPWFYWWMKNRLRSAEQGADSAIWLALTREKYPGGRFWFDRREAPTHFMKKTKESEIQREELWKLLKKEL